MGSPIGRIMQVLFKASHFVNLQPANSDGSSWWPLFVGFLPHAWCELAVGNNLKGAVSQFECSRAAADVAAQ